MDFKSTFHRLDEISAIEIESGRQIRKLRQEYLFYEGIKFILSGSGSLELKQK